MFPNKEADTPTGTQAAKARCCAEHRSRVALSCAPVLGFLLLLCCWFLCALRLRPAWLSDPTAKSAVHTLLQEKLSAANIGKAYDSLIATGMIELYSEIPGKGRYHEIANQVRNSISVSPQDTSDFLKIVSKEVSDVKSLLYTAKSARVARTHG